MSLVVEDLPAAIRATKRDLRARLPGLASVFREVEDETRREAETIAGLRERGRPVIPSIDFQAIRAGRVPDDAVREVRRRGAVVVRGVFSASQAQAWNEAIGEYLERNRYEER